MSFRRKSRRLPVPQLAALAVASMITVTPASAVHPSRLLVVTSDDLPQYRQPVDAFVAAHTGEVRLSRERREPLALLVGLEQVPRRPLGAGQLFPG